MNPPEHRTLFGQPIHDETHRFYPRHMTCEQFVAELRGALAHFEHAATHAQKHGDILCDFRAKHVEQWVETFLRQTEVMQHPVAPQPVVRPDNPLKLRDPEQVFDGFMLDIPAQDRPAPELGRS